MDTPNSLLFVEDFSHRIERIDNLANEIFVREFLSDASLNCPREVLTEIATFVLNLRRKELASASKLN